MRVLFTASGEKVGGATLAMLHLMLGLPSQGIQPILLTPTTSAIDPSLAKKLVEKSVLIIEARRRMKGVLHWLWLFLTTLRLARKLGVKIIHTHGPKEAAIMGLAAKILRLKHVYTVEGDPVIETFINKSGLKATITNKLLFKIGLRLADEVVGCSRWMATHIEKTYGRKATPIWNPIDHEKFSNSTEHQPDQKTILTAARLDKVKDIETLLHAIEDIEPMNRPKLLIAGDGPLRETLTEIVKTKKLQDNVIFLGHRTDVEKLMAKASIFILPSIYEPFGMAAAEALAAGKPVIASNIGGLREIVDHGVNGLLFTPKNHHELAQHITKLLQDKKLWTTFSQNAREKSAIYKPENIAKRYLEVYRRCLG
ncbi:glycosyl transferases group 1 [Candidatus Caldarchaeum subterraneum]|uniref:Glycosyl transferases group 1 n=1 Tax=Caldiarchaeum subterraneum TaxID=311458 RepID=E6N4R6_CALS0|nr:glycosyl transferases group 1 [Candidatus Caldarchaeum subterraneum]BAJ50133.1 glycosyl transferases group 1 [Candidatus Caldarchaeum subterraneum]